MAETVVSAESSYNIIQMTVIVLLTSSCEGYVVP